MSGQRVVALAVLVVVLGAVGYVVMPGDGECSAAAIEAFRDNYAGALKPRSEGLDAWADKRLARMGGTPCRGAAQRRLWASGVVAGLAIVGGVAAQRILEPASSSVTPPA